MSSAWGLGSSSLMGPRDTSSPADPCRSACIYLLRDVIRTGLAKHVGKSQPIQISSDHDHYGAELVRRHALGAELRAVAAAGRARIIASRHGRRRRLRFEQLAVGAPCTQSLIDRVPETAVARAVCLGPEVAVESTQDGPAAGGLRRGGGSPTPAPGGVRPPHCHPTPFLTTEHR
jgi:hypothetical protein